MLRGRISYSGILFGVVRLFLLVMSSQGYGIPRHEILKGLINGTHNQYDSRIPPNYDEDIATAVSVQVFVLSFDSVSESSMEFSVSIFLRQNWTDKRLLWNHDKIHERLEVDPKLMGQIWVPDLYFINEKQAFTHHVTHTNKLLHIYKDGSIQYSMRISMTLSCDMLLDRYPHDEQICPICLGSYSYSSDNVVFKWSRKAVVMRKGLTLPRFIVSVKEIKDCDLLFTEESMINGNYSCIQTDFLLIRQFGYYIAQVYVPSMLIVILSWVSFWIDIEATPARVSLGLLTVLSMTTQTTGEKSVLPKVSYVKAIDVWTSSCLFFVFAALLEFAYVNVQSRVQKKRKEPVDVLQPPLGNGVIDTTKTSSPKSNHFVLLRERARLQKARFADKCSRVVFPAAFAVFNMAYWIYYR